MANPIVHRELISVLRQRRAVVLQCGLAAFFALLVALRWPTDARMTLSSSRSLEVFRLLTYGLLTVLLVLLPVFPATNIVREKRQGTLALVLNTPLGPWRIFLGKLLATLALAALMLALSLPATAACSALGGVTLKSDLLPVYGVLALTALLVTTLALLVSTYAESTDAAVRWTYGLVLALSVLTLVPHYFFIGAEEPVKSIAEWLRSASPFAAMMTLQGAGDVGSRGFVSDPDVPRRFALIALLLSAGFSIWTLTRLNHTIFDRSRAAGRIADDQTLGWQFFRRLLYLVDPQRRSGSIGPFTNPVMVKEFRCRRFGRLHWLLRLVAVCAVLSLGLAILTTTRTIEWDVPTIGGIMVLLQVALLVFITPSLTAGLLSTERESGGWVLLQMTPMSVGRIIWGKLLSVFLTVGLVLCATLPGYLVMVYIEPGQLNQVQRVVVCLAITALSSMLITAAVGSLFCRTAAATAAAYSVLLTICVGPLLIWLMQNAPFAREFVERVLKINPIAAALSVIKLEGFRDYELIPDNWWILGAAGAVSLLVLIVQALRISRPQ
ncbi:MAG: ABC transporter permease [Planctomycetaceae bacterium]